MIAKFNETNNFFIRVKFVIFNGILNENHFSFRMPIFQLQLKTVKIAICIINLTHESFHYVV